MDKEKYIQNRRIEFEVPYPTKHSVLISVGLAAVGLSIFALMQILTIPVQVTCPYGITEQENVRTESSGYVSVWGALNDYHIEKAAGPSHFTRYNTSSGQYIERGSLPFSAAGFGNQCQVKWFADVQSENGEENG